MSALSIEHLTVALPRGADRPYALTDVSLSIAPGEILCVVGESGSGKSVTATTIMRLMAPGVRVHTAKLALGGLAFCQDSSSAAKWCPSMSLTRARGA